MTLPIKLTPAKPPERSTSEHNDGRQKGEFPCISASFWFQGVSASFGCHSRMAFTAFSASFDSRMDMFTSSMLSHMTSRTDLVCKVCFVPRRHSHRQVCHCNASFQRWVKTDMLPAFCQAYLSDNLGLSKRPSESQNPHVLCLKLHSPLAQEDALS
jgi:hypothetical protein